MGKKTIHLYNSILFLFTASFILFASLSIVIQISSFNSRYKKQSEVMQQDYIQDQKALVKREVDWVTDLVNAGIADLDENTRQKVRQRTEEVYSIAESIYMRNKDRIGKEDLEEVIKDALRPIRYSGGKGYCFIISTAGERVLLDNNSIDSKVIEDIRSLFREKGEGSYKSFNGSSLYSCVRVFQPLQWIIGTTLAREDEESVLQKEFLANISRIRFGREGYIFVNSLDGDALVSNGELIEDGKKLWEVFDSDPEKTRELFQKEYDAATSGGGYIYYNMRKLTDAEVESPKVSYIAGIPRWNWLIGAGVYVDDVSKNIGRIRDISYNELRKDLAVTVLLTLLLTGLFSIVFFLISRSLKRDFRAFAVFFENSLDENVRVRKDNLRFSELAELADRANTMQIEKVDALQKLKESEARFRLLAENSRDMIFKMTFPGGEMEYVSPASVEVIGFSPEEIQAESFAVRKVIHPDWSEWLEEQLEKMKNGKAEDFFEYQIISKNGDVRWVSQRNSLIPGETDGSFTLIGRLSDETRRKRAEEELNLSYRLDAVGKLAGGVAHDFNNVLAGIMNAASVLKSPRRQIDEKGRNMAELILQAASRAADLISKLSAFSGKRTLMLKPVDVHHIISETEIMLRRTLDKQIKVISELQAESSYVIGDGTELQSIILNLSINASHAISGNGEITISTENRDLDAAFCNEVPFRCTPGKYLVLSIGDTGSGIPPEIQKKIFDPFFTTKEKGKGTGLGLATVYRSVQDHQGIISVDSEVGKGTVFTIFLPCTDELPARKRTRVLSETGSGRILLIDDEEFIRTSAKGILEDLGYIVDTAGDGKAGVELFRQSPGRYNVVILDVIMPVMGGIDAFLEIRNIREECPIVMISGRTREEDLKPLRAAGISFLLRKPFSPDELYRAIIDAVEKEAADPS